MATLWPCSFFFKLSLLFFAFLCFFCAGLEKESEKEGEGLWEGEGGEWGRISSEKRGMGEGRGSEGRNIHRASPFFPLLPFAAALMLH